MAISTPPKTVAEPARPAGSEARRVLKSMDVGRRLPTAVAILLFVLGIIVFAADWLFFVFLQLVIAASLLEFYALAGKRGHAPQRVLGVLCAILIGLPFIVNGITVVMAVLACLLAAGVYFVIHTNTLERMMTFPRSLAITLFGALYLGPTLTYVFLLRRIWGYRSVLFLIAVVALGDTGAFLFGHFLGQRKMLPVASPKKTWEGGFGGLIFASLAGVAARYVFLPALPLAAAVIGGVLVHAVAQVSDALESLFKRAAGVKDSGTIFPGHGGFLDRLDSFILSAPLFFYFLYVIAL